MGSCTLERTSMYELVLDVGHAKLCQCRTGWCVTVESCFRQYMLFASTCTQSAVFAVASSLSYVSAAISCICSFHSQPCHYEAR